MTDDMIPDADGRQCVIQQLERQLAERDARIELLETVRLIQVETHDKLVAEIAERKNEIERLTHLVAERDTRYRGVSPIVREALESTREEDHG